MSGFPCSALAFGIRFDDYGDVEVYVEVDVEVDVEDAP